MEMFPHAENPDLALERGFPLEVPGRCEIINQENKKTNDKNGETAGL